MRMRTRRLPDDGALVAALADGRVVATAIWTPPWNVILSEMDDEQAIEAIADALAGDDLGGVHGPAEHAEAFARAWCERTGRPYAEGCASGVTRSRRSSLRGMSPAAFDAPARATEPS